MHTTTTNWTKVVALLAVVATGCNGGDEIFNSNPSPFTASGTWLVQGQASISYRFSSFDDDETVGDFTGYEDVLYYLPRAASGHWENNVVTFTVGTRTYTGEITWPNPMSVTFASSSGDRTLHR